MQTLKHTIDQIAMFDTHEHLISPTEYCTLQPDIITALFGVNGYIQHDLVSAGCSHQAIDAFLDQHTHDIATRWAFVADFWQHCQYTGYGEAVRRAAKILYGINHIDAASLEQAAPLQATYQGVAGYQRALEIAHLHEIQVDAFTWQPPATPEIPTLRYDLNVHTIADGSVVLDTVAAHTGIAVTTIGAYRLALQTLLRMHANDIVAIKTQHAYTRTLAWTHVADDACEHTFEKHRTGIPLTAHDALVLGDWALGVIAHEAGILGIPIKIHTGHHAGNGAMPLEWLSPRLVTPLYKAFPDTRFVCMHIGYPYHDELLSLAKHYRNVYVDLCWAWSIDPVTTSAFVRRWIHTVPISKLFGFGGDAFLPTQTVGFADQARHWLALALQAEVDDGLLTIDAAGSIAVALLSTNQRLFYVRK
jgi:predicted TIM-barrel fold metal-dependent hydrolase